MQIGKIISLSRKRKGISQEELAIRLDVSRQSVSLWETDQTIPTLDKLLALSEILEISMDELFGKKELGKNASTTIQPAPKQSQEVQNAKMEKVTFWLSFVNVILWFVAPLGIVIALTTGILSVVCICSKQTKYSIYSLIISVVFFIASIVSFQVFF